MGIASQLNIGFTLAAMNPNRGKPRDLQVKGDVVMDLRRAASHPAPESTSTVQGFSMPVNVPYRKDKAAMFGALYGQSDFIRQAIIEYQGGMHRVFRVFDGVLLHSHEFRCECVRRAQRDGYLLTNHGE